MMAKGGQNIAQHDCQNGPTQDTNSSILFSSAPRFLHKWIDMMQFAHIPRSAWCGPKHDDLDNGVAVQPSTTVLLLLSLAREPAVSTGATAKWCKEIDTYATVSLSLTKVKPLTWSSFFRVWSAQSLFTISIT
jgi:hypothetical protein